MPAHNIDYKDFADATPRHTPGFNESGKKNVNVSLQWKALDPADNFSITSKAKFDEADYTSWNPRIFNLYFSGRVETELQPTPLYDNPLSDSGLIIVELSDTLYPPSLKP